MNKTTNIFLGMACLFAALPSFGDETVASAAGGWFAADARAVKDTTWEGGAIVGGETALVLQSSPNAWGAAGGGDCAAITWQSTSGNGGTVAEATTAETVVWTPEAASGTNTLTYVSGSAVKTAQFAVVGNPVVTGVTAQQRYPWNGKVDIAYTVENAGTEVRELSVWAVDQTTGITNVAKTVTGETAYTSGRHKIVWDMSADGLTLVSTNVVFGVSYAVDPMRYCVIDLSGGTSATSYPVSYLPDVPSGGWSDEYKTTKLVLRRIGAGTFTMGSPEDESGHWDEEVQHQVMLTKDYYVGVFEVTQRQWELVMGTRPSCFNNDACYAARPVELVSYDMIRGSSAGAGWPDSSEVDATSFLGLLRAKSGLALDLPTEAQWEYACRAGTTTALNSGKNLTSTNQDSEMDKVGRYWYNGGSNYSSSVDTSGATATVGSYAPNAWGLYDMHGNVLEWCLDWYGEYSGDATDAKGPSSGLYRVLRGGHLLSVAHGCRSANRRNNLSSFSTYFSSGFRLAGGLSDGAEAGLAATSGASDPVRIDLTAGTRTAAEVETIAYSTAWESDMADATAVVSVNGAVVSEQPGSGTVTWKPTRNGAYTLTHAVYVAGEPVGEVLTSTFEVNVLAPALWGNAGTPEEPGAATETSGGSYTTFTVDFGVADNISQTGIGGNGTACISKIRLFRRSDNASPAPATVTISQAGAASAVSQSVTLVPGQKVYGPNWPADGHDYYTTAAFEAVFDSAAAFDTSKPITLTFPSAPLLMVRPCNSVMRISNGWSPAIEITGTYVASEVDYAATVGGDGKFSEISAWNPARPAAFGADDAVEVANAAAATLTLDEDVTLGSLRFRNEKGNPLTLVLASDSDVGELDFSEARGGVTLDASGVAAAELAGNAVRGVPYSHWLYSGSVRGRCDFILPDVPKGYAVEPEIVFGCGIRLVVTAPDKAQFGSVNVNFAGGRNGRTLVDDSKVGSLDTLLGGYPVVGTSWNDLAAANQTTAVAKYVDSDGTVRTDGDISVTASQVANPFTSGAAAKMLITGYLDDHNSPIVSMANIPFAKYRVIVYRATDTGGATFSAARIGTTAEDAKTYYGPDKDSSLARCTVTGGEEQVWGKSDWRSGYAEGVNYIVSDVLEGTPGEATAYVHSHKHAGRAGVAAIQVVEVGRVYTWENYEATVDADTDWSAIAWTPAKPAEGFPENAYLTITAQNDPTINFTAAVALDVPLTIDGAVTLKADDALFEDGCWEKDIARFYAFTAEDAAVPDSVMGGFCGAYAITEHGFKLRAQNKEVVSINIAGGREGGSGGNSPAANLVSGSGFYGLAPTVGDSWNNINRQWQSGGNQTIAITGPNAYDGAQIIQRPTMSLSATGRNTWQADGIANPFLRGYLDDGGGVTVLVEGIPYETYDVIVYATSDAAGVALAPITVNGMQYTYRDGAVVWGGDDWGQGLCPTPEIGKNALMVRGCTGGTLTIGATRTANGRATLCAVQVVNMGGEPLVRSDFTANVTATTMWANGRGDGLSNRSGTWKNGQLNHIALTNLAAGATLAFDTRVEAAQLEFVSDEDNPLVLPYAGLAKLDVPTLVLTDAAGGVTVDLSGVARAEATLFAGTVAGAENLTFAGAPAGWGACCDETGVYLCQAADVTRCNPVTGEAFDFAYSFFGTEDGSWENAANWRMAEDGLMKPAAAIPGVDGTYVPILVDGAVSETTEVTVSLLGGWNVRYAVLNGAHVTVNTLGKLQSLIEKPGIWVDETSSFTANNLGNNTWATNGFYVAAENGIVFPGFGSSGMTHAVVSYYFAKNGSFKYTGGVTRGTHVIRQFDIPVGAAQACRRVVKKPLVTFASSGVAFSNAADRVVKTGDAHVAAAYVEAMPAMTDAVGTYTIRQEADGVYAYYVAHSDAWDIGEARVLPPGIVLAPGAKVVATQTREEFCRGEAVDISGLLDGTEVTFGKYDGTSEVLFANAGGVATSSPGAAKIDGFATLFDVTFTNLNDVGKARWDYGTFSYKAIPEATLEYDTPATFANTNAEAQVKDRGVYIRHHPYIGGAHSTFKALGDFTAVFVGEMSPTANRIFVHFGSSLNSNQGILIATLAEKDKVGVFSNRGTALTELTALSVPNAATARHVYIVTKREVAGNTVFAIYLDGVKRAETTVAGRFVLGSTDNSGVQVGSDFGGKIRDGIYKAVEDVETETGVLNVMRIYDYMLSPAQVAALTAEYPYVPEGGLYTRTVEGAAYYAAAAAWAKDPETTPAYDVPTGTEQFLPSATLTAADEATVTVNARSDVETLTLDGAAMRFAKDAEGTNRLAVATAVVNAPVTVEYGALDLGVAAVSLNAGSLVFDFGGVDISNCYDNVKVRVTGLADESDDIRAVNLPESAGRKATFGYENGGYWLAVAVEDLPFVWNDGWTWAGVPVSAETVSRNVKPAIVVETDLSWPIDRASFTVRSGTLKATRMAEAAATVAVEPAGTFDFNGHGDGFITVNLDGGALVNSGAAVDSSHRQMQGMALAADSTVGGSGDFGLVSSGHNPNTLDLGGATLAKTGRNAFCLCNTTVTNGLLDVSQGALSIVRRPVKFVDALLRMDAGTWLDVSNPLQIDAISADGATIGNLSSITPFTLAGSASLTGNGTWGAITLAEGAVLDVGQVRGLVLGGSGTVNVVLTAAEIAQGGPMALFAEQEGAALAQGTVVDENGNAVSCSLASGVLTLVPDDDCVTFAGDGTFTLETANRAKNWDVGMQWSTDRIVWTEWNGGPIPAAWRDGSYVLCVRGDANTVVTGTQDADRGWVLTAADGGYVACLGNVETLRGATGDRPAPTPMAARCYAGLFYGCTSLTNAPAIPATELSEGCYAGMFRGCLCIGLFEEAPGAEWSLPADVRPATDWNRDMFRGTAGDRAGDPVPGTAYYVRYCAPVRVDFEAGAHGRLAQEDEKTQYVACGSRAVLPDVVPDFGYESTGWFTADEGGARVTPETIVTNDVSFYAQWRKADLGVDYVLGGHWETGTTAGGEGMVFAGLDETAEGGLSVRLRSEDDGETWIETTVTGEMWVSFDWKTSCETYGDLELDRIEFSIDGHRQAWANGETDWTNRTFAVRGGGEHTIRFAYVKDESEFSGDDSVWVANVTTAPITVVAAPVIDLAATYATESTTCAITTETEGATIRYKLDYYGDESEWFEYTGPFEVIGSKTVVAYATKPDYYDSEAVRATCERTMPWTLAECVNTPHLDFTTGGDGEWKRTTATTHDGVAAVRSGAIGDGKKTWFKVQMLGPGTISFWWKADSEYYKKTLLDYATFKVDGKEVAKIGGAADWIQVTHDVAGDGLHTYLWTYAKNAQTAMGEDCVWLDEVTWTPDTAGGVVVPTTVTGGKAVTVGTDWKDVELDEKFGPGTRTKFEKRYGADLTAALIKPSGKRDVYGSARSIWQDYVMGTDPTDKASEFKTSVEVVDGVPVITWEPDLGAARAYKVWGSENLRDWQCPTNALHRFFKVTVEME